MLVDTRKGLVADLPNNQPENSLWHDNLQFQPSGAPFKMSKTQEIKGLTTILIVI